MDTMSKRGLAGVLKIMQNRRERKEQWRAEARLLWEQWRNDPLFILGVALYWGEGTKWAKRPALALTNSDAGMLRVWLRWCQRFMADVPLDYYLGIHDNADIGAAQRFWKDQLGVEVKVVSVAVSSASKRKRNTLPYGTFRIRVGRGSVEWYTKMVVWLELIRQL